MRDHPLPQTSRRPRGLPPAQQLATRYQQWLNLATQTTSCRIAAGEHPVGLLSNRQIPTVAQPRHPDHELSDMGHPVTISRADSGDSNGSGLLDTPGA